MNNMAALTSYCSIIFSSIDQTTKRCVLDKTKHSFSLLLTVYGNMLGFVKVQASPSLLWT